MADLQRASVVVDGVLRIQVRSHARAGDELMVELEWLAPDLVGLPLVLEDGPRALQALITQELEQDGRTVLICELSADLAGERGAFG